jgi:transmembrane sensor
LEKSAEPELVNTDAFIDKIWQQGVGEGTKKISKSREWSYISKVAAIFFIFVSTPFLIYKIMNQPSETITKSVMVVKENPAGQKSKIVLPDGSIVWLNAASSITFSTYFNDSDRVIDMKGEAYFDVARNPDKPFIVKSENLVVTALGTSFNIQAYSEQDEIKISLLTGQVRVENSRDQQNPLILAPGYEIVYLKATNELIDQEFKSHEAIGWKDGVLVFRNADYGEVTNKLGRWYGIEVITEGNPPADWKLSTSYKDEVLINILRNLRFGKGFNFELQKEKLIIRFN